MRKSSLVLVGALSAGVLSACGQSTPSAPTPSPVAVPSPTPTPAPAPTPAPSPTPCPDCEPTVTNDNPAVRVTIRLYVIEDPGGGYIGNPDPGNVPVGYTARLDVTSKDIDNRETVGRRPMEFFFSNPALVRVWGNHTNQRRVQGLGPGQVDCWAVQDGTRSNTLTLTFTR